MPLFEFWEGHKRASPISLQGRANDCKELEMIDLLTEQVMKLSDAAKLLPRRRLGKRPHRTTLDRWGKIGFRGIFLDTIVIGDTTCTSVQDLQRFADALTQGAGAQSSQPATDRGSNKSEDAVERELESRGL
jgi:hypothetical protein